MYKQLLCQLTKIHYTTRKTPTGHYFNTKKQYCALSLCQKMSPFWHISAVHTYGKSAQAKKSRKPPPLKETNAIGKLDTLFRTTCKPAAKIKFLLCKKGA
jgi:hypothetical protein